MAPTWLPDERFSGTGEISMRDLPFGSQYQDARLRLEPKFTNKGERIVIEKE